MTTTTTELKVPKKAKAAIEKKSDAPRPAVKIHEAAVLLSVNMGRLEVWRKASKAKVTVEADEDGTETDKDAIHVNKEILDCDELKAIYKVDGKVREFMYTHCLPSIFKKGIYLMPIALLDTVIGRLEAFEQERADRLNDFMAVYEKAAAEARDRLGALYDEDDYPDPQKVRSLFTFRTQLMEMSVPGQLKSLKASLYRREVEKAERMWDESKRQISAALYEEFQKLVKRMTDNMANGEDGKRKRFKDTTFERMQEWIELFKARNLTDDQTIVKMVEQAKVLVQGVDAKTVRDSDQVRKQLADQFGRLEKELEKQIETLPERAISFD